MSDPRPASRPLPPVAIVIGVLFFFGLLGLMVYGVMKSGAPDRDILPSALIGKPAPAFELPVLHDPSIKVSSNQLRGAPYVLNVWGSWCAACREEHPILTRFAETKRVRVIGYNWKDEPADALRWLEQLGNPFVLVLSDIEGRTAIDWGVTAAPETFLVDASGVVRWKYSGALTQRVIDTKLLPELEKLERANAQPRTTPPPAN
jgi:cytochrome c biogenesis protein CcmG/thiol:disulfide interchange protein DsbE